MNNVPPSLGLVVAASITFARALWTKKRNSLVEERIRGRVPRSESSLNATGVGRRRALGSRTVTRRSSSLLALVALAGTILFALTLPPASAQGIGGGPSDPSSDGPNTPGNGSDYEGPVGVAGIFNGNITTACSYDPLTHSAKRTITDIVVPGSVGKYPLKMTRYYDSRAQYYAFGIGLSPSWEHEYGYLLWSGGHKVVSPNGSTYDDSCGPPVGISEIWTPNPDQIHYPGYGTFRLADGGTVVFTAYWATQIIDPHGLITTIDRTGSRINRVTEPGGRYLQFYYRDSDTVYGFTVPLLTTVEAHGLGDSTVTDWVNYSYNPPVWPGGSGQSMKMLQRVDYSDGTYATYTYDQDNVTENLPTSSKLYPRLASCDDKRYNGPMRQIVYEYQPGGPRGAILSEKYPGTGPISTISPGVPPRGQLGELPNVYTEKRGDGPSGNGPTRTFTYTHFLPCQHGSDCGVCDDYLNNTPPQQMLWQYTDFNGKTTYLDYDTNWYIKLVTDARGTGRGDQNYTTFYQRGPRPPTGIGEITRITHPDGTYIQYGYNDAQNGTDPHYVMATRNERGYWTTHTRDNHRRIIRTDYPDSSYETFTYDDFNLGLVKTHRLKSSAYQHFQYNSRGLLLAKTNPTWNPDHDNSLATDPITTYSYYSTGDPDGGNAWVDRVKKMTLPANGNGQIASETYEYDRAAGTAVPGRGLVTKMIHADNYYKSFGYDAFGNKVLETNELSKQTSYIYDSYNRLTSVTDPLIHTTAYSYEATNGSQDLSAMLHTTSSIHLITTPTGIVTENRYDPNFRKISTTQGFGSSSPATTWFDYDNVGNQVYVTDPRGSSTPSASWTTYTDYDSRNRQTRITEPLVNGEPTSHVTQFLYEDGINVTRIIRADSTTERKTYDSMNRVTYDTVPPNEVNGPNLTTHFIYYTSGMVHTVTDPKNLTTQFVYTPADLKKTMTYPNGTDYQTWTWDNVYNLQHRRTVNNEQQTFSYDNRNRKYAMTWNNQAEWAYFNYDPASRLLTAENGPGAWWDGTDNSRTSTVSPRYDDAGRMVHEYQNVVGAGAYDVQYSYNDDNKVTHVHIPNPDPQNSHPIYDQSRNYNDGQYPDPLGRLSIIGDQWRGNTIQYHYDAASNITERDTLIFPNGGSALTYVPDNLNRIVGRNISLNNGTISETYTYNSMNRLIRVYRAADHDAFGYYQDGELYWAQYGLSGGPGSPIGGGDIVPSGPGGGPAGDDWTEPDGTIPGDTSLSSDPSIPKSDPTNPGYTEGPDTGGAVVGDADPGDPPPGDTGPSGGDGLDQPDTTQSVRTVNYYLDFAGNRTNVADTGTNTAYTQTPATTNLNEYAQVGSDSVNNGNEHQIALYQGVHYNYLNDTHLVLATSGNNNYNTYALAYDAMGRCVKRTLTVNTVPPTVTTTYYIYDGEKPIQEIGPTWASTVYGMGIDEPVIRFTSTRVYYFYQDHEGSVTHVAYSDAHSSGPIEQYRYDAFGSPTIRDGSGNPVNPPGISPIGNRFMFTGREWAPGNLGFYEYRARAYHPGLGRFMSEDPKLFDAGDYNLYRYCHNDPEDLTDPMGLTDIQMSPQLVGLIWQASVNSLAAYNHASDRMGRSQLIVYKVDNNGKVATQPTLQKDPSGANIINKSQIKVELRQEYQQYHTGERYRYIEQEKADAGRDKAAAIGHMHADKTGHGMSEWSGTDIDSASGTKTQKGIPVGRIDESNPSVMRVLVPQVEGGDPKERTFNASIFKSSRDPADDHASNVINSKPDPEHR